MGKTVPMAEARPNPGRGDLPLGTRPLTFLLALVAVGAVALVSGTWLANLVGAGIIEGGPELTDVPEVVGSQEQEAITLIEEAGLVAEVVTVVNVQVPPGEVVSQRPLAGERVDAGSTVEVTVSVGDEWTRVPDLTGAPNQELFLFLAAYGLVVGEVTYEESDARENEVLRQNPVAGELLEIGGAVDVVLSSGPPMVTIPDVRGEDEADAIRALRDAGFTPQIREGFSDWIPRGQAIATQPEAGAEAPRGSVIVVFISEGRPPTTRPPATTTTQPSEDDDGDENGNGNGNGTTTTSSTTTTAPPPTTSPTTTTTEAGNNSSSNNGNG